MKERAGEHLEADLELRVDDAHGVGRPQLDHENLHVHAIDGHHDRVALGEGREDAGDGGLEGRAWVCRARGELVVLFQTRGRKASPGKRGPGERRGFEAAVSYERLQLCERALGQRGALDDERVAVTHAHGAQQPQRHDDRPLGCRELEHAHMARRSGRTGEGELEEHRARHVRRRHPGHERLQHRRGQQDLVALG